jgi:hypothetical protein
MGKVVKFEATRPSLTRSPGNAIRCPHRQREVSASERRVWCGACGKTLDPIEVLVWVSEELEYYKRLSGTD